MTIRFEEVSKRYQLGFGQSSLREALIALPKHFLGRNHRSVDQDEHWALKDVSFKVEQGQVLGIIGNNGAGKTTTLKLLSKITKPTTGQIEINGRVSALIELGAGFHPDLTGRENVYLNGVILGLSQQEITKKFDSIVAFAELEKFIDTPVKRYSSGMYARLGFAVAAHVDPDVLLVDEVLSVGDANFQKKCHDFIHAFVTKGNNMAILVSHNLMIIDHLCTQVIWLDQGQIAMIGEPSQVLKAYFDKMDQQRVLEPGIDLEPEHRSNLRIVRVSCMDAAGNEKGVFTSGEDIIVEVEYHTEHIIYKPHFALGALDSQIGDQHPLFKANMLVDGNVPPFIEGTGVIRCKFASVPLMPRTYDIWGEVWGADRVQRLVLWRKLGTFRIVDRPNEQKPENGRGTITRMRIDAPIRVPYEWEY